MDMSTVLAITSTQYLERNNPLLQYITTYVEVVEQRRSENKKENPRERAKIKCVRINI